jgi:hypothetical protein
VTLLASWFWLLAALVILVALERWIHRHVQGLWLLLTRSPDLALILYSLLFLPGILVHELSHWLVATVLLVRAPRVSVWPQRQPDGTVRLGYVETERVDFVREAMIGAAPLIAGCAAILWIGRYRLALGPVGPALAAGDLGGVLLALAAAAGSTDVFIWLYLVFAVSNAMMPSASDRRAWPLLLLALAALGALTYWAGFGPLLARQLAGPATAGLQIVASAFTLTIGIDLAAVGVVWALESGLSRLTGLKVQY